MELESSQPESILSREQVRRVDRIAIEQFGIPGIVLMENAGRSCAEILVNRVEKSNGIEPSGQAVVICCGVGNNGGDGFVIARHLFNWGVAVKILLFSPPILEHRDLTEMLPEDAATNWRISQKMGIETQYVALDVDSFELNSLSEQMQSVAGKPTTWVVDALLGTGSRLPLRSPLNHVIECANSIQCQRMAIDIPTGMDCDSGETDRSVFHAGVTCTFVAKKPGLVSKNGRQYCGDIHVVDIGAPRKAIQMAQKA